MRKQVLTGRNKTNANGKENAQETRDLFTGVGFHKKTLRLHWWVHKELGLFNPFLTQAIIKIEVESFLSQVVRANSHKALYIKFEALDHFTIFGVATSQHSYISFLWITTQLKCCSNSIAILALTRCHILEWFAVLDNLACELSPHLESNTKKEDIMCS